MIILVLAQLRVIISLNWCSFTAVWGKDRQGKNVESCCVPHPTCHHNDRTTFRKTLKRTRYLTDLVWVEIVSGSFRHLFRVARLSCPMIILERLQSRNGRVAGVMVMRNKLYRSGIYIEAVCSLICRSTLRTNKLPTGRRDNVTKANIHTNHDLQYLFR